MTNKVLVKICVGTTCYVKGNRELKKAMENLPADIKGRVEIKGVIDIDGCESGKGGENPYIEINGRVLANATVEKALSAIRKELNVIA